MFHNSPEVHKIYNVSPLTAENLKYITIKDYKCSFVIAYMDHKFIT